MLTPDLNHTTTLLQVVAVLDVDPPDTRTARLAVGDVVLVETHDAVVTGVATPSYDDEGRAEPRLWLWRDPERRTA